LEVLLPWLLAKLAESLATANSQGRNFVAGEEVKTPSCENLLGAIWPPRSEMNRA
jgi:hypothetical protein